MLLGKCPACGSYLIIVVIDSTRGWIFKEVCSERKTSGCK